jgi:ribosome-associated heat shock protein Hsp15
VAPCPKGKHVTDDAHKEPGLSESQRLDKWLWYARVARTRTLSAQLVLDGRVRVNRAKATKPGQAVRPGDVLTIAAHGGVINVIKILLPGKRRGPPAEARLLYELVTSLGRSAVPEPASERRDPGTGRPTKRDRRVIDRLKEED